MDIYGFKLVDLFIPYIRHHSDTFAKFGLAHRQASVLNDEEGCAYLGMIGIACLLWLVAVSMRAMAERRESAVPLAAWQVFWIVIMFNTGGLNSIVAAFTGFTLFRTACRYSIVVLAIVLLWAARRLTAWQQDDGKRLPPDTLQIATSTVAAGLCLLVLWDQVPRAPVPEQVATIARQVAADRDFVEKLELALPEKAMVFQLPVMDGSPLPGVPSSDHYRPYLYSHGLRFTMGATKGSESEVWQQAVQKQLLNGATLNQQTQQILFNQNSVGAAVEEMRKRGFAAIYVNRNGFPDRGKGLEKSLLELGYLKPPIDSAGGDLVCIPLEKN
jgi:phosphoglycerol transferase